MSVERPPAVILAGGAGRRMGGDKALTRFAGATLVRAVALRLAPQCAALAINANGDPARFADLGLAVLPDPLPGLPGPLAGVLAAMRWAADLGAARVLCAPVDAPFLPPDLGPRLAAAPGLAMAADARGDLQPAFALWPVALAPALEAALRADPGGLSIRAFALAQDPRIVTFAADGDRDPFLNLNTPAELRAADPSP